MQRRHLAQLTAIAIMKFSGVSFTFYMLVIGVEAQVTVDPPQNTTVTLGGIATFSCAVSDVANITFVVAGVDPSMWASRGISQSTSVSGGYTTANLTVQGNITNNGILVTCRVGYTDILPPAQLTIKEVEVDPPKNTTVPLGSNATFSCTASNVAGIDFVVAGVDHSMWASRGIIPSAPAYSGNATTTNLTVLGTIANNGLQITCRVYVTVTSHVDQLPPAQLTVEAPPSAPLNLTAAAVGGTYVVLTWSPPMDLGIGGPLYYNVSYQAVSGPNGASNVTSINTTYTNITVTNLYPGVTYMMTVEADNGGSGEESKRSASINVATISPPSAPQHLTAAAVAGTYVVLTWSPPMDPGIGGPLYYNVSYQAVNGSSNVTSVITTSDTHVNVTNLYPGVTYMMTVEADNGVAGDESKRSASINVTTNSTSPSPTQIAPPPASAVAWKVGVGVVVGVVGAVILLVMVLVLMYKKPGMVKLCTGIHGKHRNSTSSTTSTNSAQSTGGKSLYIQYPS